MNEVDVLAQLRDIHLPAELGAAAATQFAVWPFVVLALVVVAISLARLWGRSQWRRSAQVELSEILSIEDETARWHELLAFASSLSGRSGQSVTLPRSAFLRPESISGDQRTEFVAFLRAALRR